mgnify:CR=1 FL=1
MHLIIVSLRSVPFQRTSRMIRGIQHIGQRCFEVCLHFVGIGMEIEVRGDDNNNRRHVKASDGAIADGKSDKFCG